MEGHKITKVQRPDESDVISPRQMVRSLRPMTLPIPLPPPTYVVFCSLLSVYFRFLPVSLSASAGIRSALCRKNASAQPAFAQILA